MEKGEGDVREGMTEGEMGEIKREGDRENEG